MEKNRAFRFRLTAESWCEGCHMDRYQIGVDIAGYITDGNSDFHRVTTLGADDYEDACEKAQLVDRILRTITALDGLKYVNKKK